MDKRLRTGVVAKYSKQINKQIKIVREISLGKRYVYKLKSDEDYYVLKGYIIRLPIQKQNTKVLKDDFFDFINQVGAIYREYFFSKMACLINPHFTMPLDIDFDVELSEDGFSYTSLIFEVIFEYGGDSLENLGSMNVNTAYNLMKQSGDAFSTLHNIGVIHFDIKPANMVYKDNMLKVIDLGSSYGYRTADRIYKTTKTVASKVRELTEAFSPPEILKELANDGSVEIQFELGKIDVYSWAMSFFVMISGRSDRDLEIDIAKYKKTKEKAYEKYIENIVKPELDKIPTNGAKEDNMKKIIQEILIKQLSYKPSSRSTMNEIVASLRKLENKENAQISSKVNHEKKRKSFDTPYPQKDLTICKDCENGWYQKVELECGHKMCKKCIRKYVLEKFVNGKPYNYNAFCNICKKQMRLSTILLGCRCKCKWTEFDMPIELSNNGKGDICFGMCDKRGNITRVDSYLIKDIIAYQAIYSHYFEFIKNKLTNNKLDLYFKQIGYEGAKVIADSLKNNKILAELDINHNEIADEGAKVIAESLKNNRTLTVLKIDHNEIGDEGAKAIADSLKYNKSLIELRINSNEIGNEGIEAIADSLQKNKTLARLNISNNQMGYESVKAIAYSLEINNSLVEFRIDHNEIADKGAKAISNSVKNNRSLIILDISWNKIGEKGAEAIAGLLKYNKSLTTLNIGDNEIGDEGVEVIVDSLKNNESLTDLNIYYNKIGNEGAKAIADFLKYNKSLTKLDLNKNQIGDEGAKAITNSLKYNKTLIKLDIKENAIGYDEVSALRKAQKMNKNLKISI